MASKKPWILTANLLYIYALLVAFIAAGVFAFALTYGRNQEEALLLLESASPAQREQALASVMDTNAMDILPDPTPAPTPEPPSLKGRIIPYFSPQDELWGYKNTKGQVVIKPKSTSAREFCGDIAFAADASGLWGLLSIQDVWLCEPQWTNTQDFSENYAAVEKDGKWGYIDMRGNLVIDYQYREAHPFHCGRAAVREKSTYAYIDIWGNAAVRANWREAQPFSEDLAFVTSDEYEVDRHYIIDKVGEKRATLGSKVNGTIFSEGFAVVCENNDYYYINAKGKTAFKQKYEDARAFSFGYAAVKQNGLWGYINDRGVMVIEPAFASALSFTRDNLAAVKDAQTGKWGYISRDGSYAIEARYDEAQDFRSGFALAKQGSTWYLLDCEGNAIDFYDM